MYTNIKKLLYLAEDENGGVSLEKESEGLLKNKRYSVRIEYNDADIAHALRANYMFFARDRSLLPKIMNSFLMEIRE